MVRKNKKAGFQLSVSFLVTLIITIAIFTFSISMLRKFFGHAEDVKMVWDERSEKEIERLMDDGSRIAIPFDKKTIRNGEFDSFGIGILNILNTGATNNFEITVKFNKAFRKDNSPICDISDSSNCGQPEGWLLTSGGTDIAEGVNINMPVSNNEQRKFLLGVEVGGADKGTYIFDMLVCADNGEAEDLAKCPNAGYTYPYDSLKKIYVDVR